MTFPQTSDRPAPATCEAHVAMTVGGQLFGLPVLKVHDVLAEVRLTRVPLAPPEVAGNFNLRGRIVTAIDLRMRLGFAPRGKDAPSMCVVIEHQGEFYGLIVDSVGEVMSLDSAGCDREMALQDGRWRDVARGVHRLDEALLVLLEVAHLLTFNKAKAA